MFALNTRSHSTTMHRWCAPLVALLATTLLLASTGCKKDPKPAAQAAGGNGKQQTSADGQVSPQNKPQAGGSERRALGADTASPEAILGELVETYRQAKSYRDQATVRVSYQIDGQKFEDQAPLSVTFERPNRLRLEAYRTRVISNEETLYARITDEATDNIDGQIVVRPAPPKLHLQDIYGDALLAQVIGAGLARYPVQLELLLDENPLASALGKKSQRKVLSPNKIDGHKCHRIQVTSPEGAFVFWIDQKSNLLRRLEYPTGHMQPEADLDSEVQNLSLTVEFTEAQFDADATSETFNFMVPPDAKQVRYFVPPPQPLPTNLFGKQPADFSFKTLEDQTVSTKTLRGKTVAMLWFNNHPAGEASLTALDKVAEQLADNDKIECYGICTEPSQTTDLQIVNLMRQWRVKLPIARDLSAVGRDVFSIPVWPTLVVLDGQGRLQLFETGHIDDVYDALPEVLQQIAAGENLGQQIMASYETELADYEQALATASGATDSSVVEIPTVQIAPRNQPNAHQLQEVWSNSEIASPGNMLLLAASETEPARLLVLSNNRAVFELDMAGKTLAQHELPIPESAGVQHLISQSDAQGNRYYLAWANLGKQLFLFDQSWQLQASYPELKQEHDGIRDCTLADLKGEGDLNIYVAFWGAAGVHEVSLAGERKWTNRAATAPQSLTLGPLDAIGRRQLLISTAAGNLLPLNPSGREMPPRTIGSYAVHDMARSPLTDMQTPYCAFSLTAEGASRAIAVDTDFVERWSYELPEGAHRNALRPVAAGHVLPGSAGDWVLAGADGSLHTIAADGSASDFFYWGEEITGLEATRGEQRLLLVATARGVQAVRLVSK